MDNFFNFRTEKKIVIKVMEPEVEMGIIKRLSKPKFWVSNNDFNETMEKIYRAISKNAKEMHEKMINEEGVASAVT